MWATLSQLLGFGSATSSNCAEEGHASLVAPTAGTGALQHKLLVTALGRELVLPVLLEVVAERDVCGRATTVREEEGVHCKS